MKFNRFTLVAAVLALGAAACGDDVQVVEPTPPQPPPPPPVEATMAPASASVTVGSSVVFAVTASGGVAGEAASWTCSSSNTGIATASVVSAGCQATGVAAGEVTITAAVSKSGETVNVGASLTVTSDQPPPPETGDPATILISRVEGESRDQVEGSLAGRVEVDVSLDRGDQEIEELTLFVGDSMVANQTFGGNGMMTPPVEDAAAEQSAGNIITMAFDSHKYNKETGEVAFPNGDHDIRAELEIGVDLPDGTHSHATEHSNTVTRNFDNDDIVRVSYSGLGEGIMNSSTGRIWHGGPNAVVQISALPVRYSGDPVASLTLLEFCGADAATSEAPFVFTPECEKYVSPNDGEAPSFTVGGASIKTSGGKVYLDFVAPTAPVFKVNPNSREGGWLNAAVNLTGENGSGSKKNGWLIYYDDNADDTGVGGYIPQLRYSTSDPRSVAAARAAMPSANPELPAETTSASKICFIVTATDLLGNESALPSASKGCIAAGKEGKVEDDGSIMEGNEGSAYGALVTTLKSALAREDADDIADARKALRDNGLQAGVDVTPPTAEFTRTSLGTNRRTGAAAREIDSNDEFKVTVEDTRSGINEAKALVADLEVRDADGTKCVRGGKTTSSVSQCGGAFKGFGYSSGDDLASTNILPLGANDVGYYTFTAQAQDKAGNLSEEISDVALSDTDYPARANVRVTEGSSSKPLAYTLDINLDDDLSVRDYYVAMTVGTTVGPVTDVTPIRLGDTEQVDAYNASELTTDMDAAKKVTLPFLGLVTTAGAGDAEEIDMMQVYVRDQRAGPQIDANDDGNFDTGDLLYAVDESGARVSLTTFADASGTTAAVGDGFATGISLTAAVTAPATLDDDDDEVTLTATATAASADDANTEPDESTANPFKRVLFYALSSTTDNPNAVADWRFIGSVSKNDADGLVYTLETDAGEIAAIMDDNGGDDYSTASGNIIAIGIKDDVAAEDAVADDPDTTGDDETEGEVKARTGVVGLVSAAVDLAAIDL